VGSGGLLGVSLCVSVLWLVDGVKLPFHGVKLSLPWLRYALPLYDDVSSACLYPCSAAEVARKFVKDPELLRFIDLECYIWSTVSAELTPMMNAGMVGRPTFVDK